MRCPPAARFSGNFVWRVLQQRLHDRRVRLPVDRSPSPPARAGGDGFRPGAHRSPATSRPRSSSRLGQRRHLRAVLAPGGGSADEQHVHRHDHRRQRPRVPGPGQRLLPGRAEGSSRAWASASCSATRATRCFATLTAPNAQTYSFNSNVSPDVTELENGIQDYVDHPMAGRWVLSLQILNPVSGTVTSSPFKVRIRYNSVSAKAPQLPTSAKTKLKQGQPVTIAVTVTDSSVKQSELLRRSPPRSGRHAVAGRAQREQHVPAAAAGLRYPVLARAKPRVVGLDDRGRGPAGQRRLLLAGREPGRLLRRPPATRRR